MRNKALITQKASTTTLYWLFAIIPGSTTLAKTHKNLFTVFFTEFINATRCINNALLSCIKRMA